MMPKGHDWCALPDGHELAATSRARHRSVTERKNRIRPESEKKQHRDYMQERLKDPQYRKAAQDRVLMWSHGLTRKELDEISTAQKHKCLICGKPETLVRKGQLCRLSIDHDHKCCGKNKSCKFCRRGLLCHDCNTGLGKFNDDPQLLRAAADYIEAHARKRPGGKLF
jgi:ribosomal protein S14